MDMTSFYRYSAKKYNDALLALGNVRIGTLHDFRNEEHKKGIADVNEGKKTVSHIIKYANSDDGPSIHFDAIEKFGAIGRNKDSSILLENVHLSRDFSFPDCYIHCASQLYSSETMAQFEGSDSCVEIFDVLGFYNRLTETLGTVQPVRLHTVQKVFYMEREERWDGKTWGVHPALIKEPVFSPQVEVRAIWIPVLAGNISPVVINDVGLIRYCRSKKIPQ
ncbi:hypothetical protein [Pseudomonas sp. NPDC096925]|uniref:hypothetical protein n=1 Tax=Pseudomonas sp. NPDC096925 TaxID=3364484 RepID=UPI00383B50E8